jgi:hypothetical protein
LLVELTLLWFLWILISIDDVPLLVNLSMLVESDDVSVLVIKSTFNIEDLSFLVDNEWSLISEHLPPS